MGRSKFPGRPSKHILRKRINVLLPADELPNDETGGLVTVESVVENKQENNDAKEKNNENVFIQNINKKSMKRRLTRKMKTLINSNANQRNLFSKLRVTSMKTKLGIHKMGHNNKSTKETAGLVGKFVLPTRSVHSSRVIKPNKRFVNDLNESISKKKLIVQRKEEQIEKDKSDGGQEDKASNNGFRVILRQARLKLPSQTGAHGPFTKVNTSMATTITCGVCGAVKYDQLMKHTRKYNIYSCELCRKFIAKMIKIQACQRHTTLVCSKGQGTCYVSPIGRNQQWKAIKYSNRIRCSACLLKMCLRAFQLPSTLKQNLSQMLPKHMQNFDFLNSTLPPLLWQAPTDSSPVLKNYSPVTKQRPVRFKSIKTATATSPFSNFEVKRQKNDLKGPRVKHVCRTASVVFGQPLATFTDGDRKCGVQNQFKSIEKKVDCSDSKSETQYSEMENNVYDKSSVDMMEPILKREKIFRNLPLISQNSSKLFEEKKRQDNSQLDICINYCDLYDLENVYKNGFCLIGSEQFPTIAVCFLCGSAGKDQMYYCSLCCEPYHSFCLEQENLVMSLRKKTQTWICPKCANCNKCNMTDRWMISCQKCLKPYHRECLNSESEFYKNFLVCSKCLKCNTCNSVDDTYFIGSSIICLMCFKRKKEGELCPICQHPYKDNNVVPKIMECGKCVKWIHAKCENLTEDQYQILCLLPESIQYVCSLCNENPSLWRNFVNNELKQRFKKVLRNLMKNKTVHNMLKAKSKLSRQLKMSEKVQYLDEIDSGNNNCVKEITDVSKDTEKLKSTVGKDGNISPLIDLKNKLNSDAYLSVGTFYKDLEDFLKNSEEVLKIFQDIFYEVFPWYKISEDTLNKENVIHEEPIYECYKNEEFTSEEVYFASDIRICQFCRGVGDGYLKKESRLLYCGHNEWVHANCAFWSSEVYEEIDGSLQNVHDALKRSRLMHCFYCKQRGASVDCCYKGCGESYHFNCGRIAKVKFLQNKLVFCTHHDILEANQIITDEEKFIIRRRMFVDLKFDNVIEKFVEIDKITLMIGSLCVKNLGKIDPVASDHVDFIVPMGFVCTKMFWSTVEPWKIIPYTIITSIKNPNNNVSNVDKNFTIDYSLNKEVVDKLLKELNTWHRDLDKKTCGTDSEDDEQQNGTDILSPELTDAILEELPHGLLDGIFVQDIFPKFSSDDVSVDYKSDTNNSEQSLDTYKKTDLEDPIPDGEVNQASVNSCEKSTTNSELNQPSQNSCNLSIKCKINSSSPIVKKRRLGNTRENNMVYQLVQVDGNCDDSSSECDSPVDSLDLKAWDNLVLEEPVTCEKCHCTYRTQASYKRHLDSCEILCTSESDSEVIPDQDILLSNNNEQSENTTEPVLISYESYQSEIHTSILNTQSYMLSKSTTELLTPQVSEIRIQQPSNEIIEEKPLINPVPISTIPSTTMETTGMEDGFTVAQPSLSMSNNTPLTTSTNQAQLCNLSQTVPLCIGQPLTLEQNDIQNSYTQNQLLSVNSTNMLSIPSTSSVIVNQISQQPINFQSQSISLPQVPSIVNSESSNRYSLNGKLVVNPVIQTVGVPETQWIKQANNKPTVKPLKSKTTCRTLATKKIQLEEKNSNAPNQNSTGQLIVQQLPSTNYIPFVEAYQQQNQNVQYVTITPQAVPTQQLVQIQPYNNLFGIVPGQLQQRTMYIQQPRMVENQLIVDTSGTIGWSQQQTIQPVYYGFETIVQNTVMQSQQLLPTTVPGILTANSSFSTTTQVFQTSKLEPVLDVPMNSFILVNPAPLVNSQSIINPQPILNTPSLTNSHTQLITNPQQLINPQSTLNSQQVMSPQQIVNRQNLNHSPQVVNLQPMVNTQQFINAPSQMVSPRPAVHSQAIVNPQPVVIAQPIMKSQNVEHNITQHNPAQPIMVLNSKLPQQKFDINTSNTSTINHSLDLPQILNNNLIQQVDIKIPHQQFKVKPMQTQFTIKSSHSQEVKPQVQTKLETKPSQQNTQNTKYSTNSFNKPVTSCSNINLPTSFISDQGIPTNVVAPIPKPVQTRPMSRVLPMPTNFVKESEKFSSCEPNVDEDCKHSATETVNDEHKLKTSPVPDEPKTVFASESKIKLLVNHLKSNSPISDTNDNNLKLANSEENTQEVEKKLQTEPVAQKVVEISISEDTKVHASLKLVFQKQGEDGSYIISNNFNNKQPIQVATLKPIKSFNANQDVEQLISGKDEDFKEKAGKLTSETSKLQNKKENSCHVVYAIETQDGFKYTSSSTNNLWSTVIEAVQTARAAHDMPLLPVEKAVLDSVHMLGLKSDNLRYLIEQLPGITKCSKYKSLFNFVGRVNEMDDEFSHHSFGAIRCFPFEKKNIGHYDIFGWLSSKHRQPEHISLDTLELLPRRIVNLPMTMKFRQLKLTSRLSVGVYRSGIHGRGLFCLRDIEAGEMVIEYAGEVIRSILTDKREKYYNSKGIGCYMFRVDDNFVVDATMKGNAARFINHSCEPNCYSRVVEILGHKHIIIFALRRILCGEELTYDYKFPFEEDKIPCTCGSRKCRKFLN